jgi:putative endonuclease
MVVMNKKHGCYYLYMVRCSNVTYYTGSAKDLDNRIKLHDSGHGAKYLKGKGPVRLVYSKEYKYYKNVLHAERNLKKLTREQKDNLIRNYESSKLSQST